MNHNYNNKFMENQQHNNYNDNILSEEFIQSAKKQPTKIHVVLKKKVEGETVEEQRLTFDTEDDARDQAEWLALSESYISLDLWEYRRTDISDVYVLHDTTELLKTVYIINIYPV